MRIYGRFHHIGGELLEVSLSPYERDNCMFLDLEEGKSYNILNDWKIYNGAVFLGKYIYDMLQKDAYNLPCDLGDFDSPIIREEDSIIELEDGRTINTDDEKYDTYTYVEKYQWYKHGKPGKIFLRRVVK